MSVATVEPCIKLRGIGKSFGGISVLRDVNLDINPGEIHGLVGENGAGKSTLGKIMGGYYSASRGSIEVFGEPAKAWTPKDALQRGVAIMHQELQLVTELTVAQNVFLGIEENRGGILSGTENSRLASIVAATGFDLQASAKVSDLSIADQQKIEIMRALARDAKIIIMDEPTSSLTADETERLHETMINLRRSGGTVIYVSHFLDNILKVCDRITVLRDGNLIKTGNGACETKETLVSAMLGGAQIEVPHQARPAVNRKNIALEVKGLCSSNGTSNVSLKVGRGEIVGLIGLVGSGRTEIARSVIGADDATEGEVLVHGSPYKNRNLAKSNEKGLIMVPEDRRKQGLILTMPVRANMTLPHLSAFATRLGRIRLRKEWARASELIRHFDVKPSDVDGNVLNYSGGNQQKVLLGKWLLRNPEIVILDEPSRGVDVGARQRIHQAIGELADNGTAVLLISSELEEVLGLSHRAYLVSSGEIFEEIDPSEKSEREVLRSLFHQQGSITQRTRSHN